jgi:hypothetical protein
MNRRALLLPCLCLLAACVDTRGSQDRGGPFDNAHLYRAPEASRCEKYKKGNGAAAACAEARYLGEGYVRKLATGDEICLDGGFGDVAGAACKARGLVADTGTNRVLVEVRDPHPDSKWFKQERNQFWFEEGALVDLYLADHGY